MKSDYDLKLKSLFDQANTELPDEEFNRQLMLKVRYLKRRDALLFYTGLVAALICAWVLAPDLLALSVQLSSYIESAMQRLLKLIMTVSLSPLTWMYALALGWYLIFKQRGVRKT